jgi:hypothetical protein
VRLGRSLGALPVYALRPSISDITSLSPSSCRVEAVSASVSGIAHCAATGRKVRRRMAATRPSV